MPLIPLNCPLCGASLSIDSTKDATICESCGKPFIVKDAIINSYVGGAAAPAPAPAATPAAEKPDEAPTIKTNINVEEKSRWEMNGTFEPTTRTRNIYHKHKDFVIDEDVCRNSRQRQEHRLLRLFGQRQCHRNNHPRERHQNRLLRLFELHQFKKGHNQGQGNLHCRKSVSQLHGSHRGKYSRQRQPHGRIYF